MSKKSETGASGEKEIMKLLRLVLIAGRSNSINKSPTKLHLNKI